LQLKICTCFSYDEPGSKPCADFFGLIPAIIQIALDSIQFSVGYSEGFKSGNLNLFLILPVNLIEKRIYHGKF
jgi:hypothetical protein